MDKFPYYKNFSPVKNFFFLFFILGVSYLSVWFLGKRPVLAALPIILAGALALFYFRSWKLLLTYISFFIFGTWMEIFLINNGFWTYGTKSFLAIPFYLPFIWGNIVILCIGILKGIPMVFGRRFQQRPPRFLPSFLLTLALFPVLTLSTLFFADHLLLMVIFLFCVDILYVIYMKNIMLAFVGIFALACGTIGDLTFVWLGIWSYSAAVKVAGVPPYIFIGWDLTGILMAGLYMILDAPDSPLPKWMKKDDMA